MPLTVEHRLTEVEDRSKSNMHRIDKLEERQDNLDKIASSVQVLATRQEQVESDVKEIKSDVKTIAAKPAKRWEDLVTKVVGLIVAAVVGFLLARIGL